WCAPAPATTTWRPARGTTSQTAATEATTSPPAPAPTSSTGVRGRTASRAGTATTRSAAARGAMRFPARRATTSCSGRPTPASQRAHVAPVAARGPRRDDRRRAPVPAPDLDQLPRAADAGDPVGRSTDERARRRSGRGELGPLHDPPRAVADRAHPAVGEGPT